MFDRIALINLDKRTDRLGAFKAKVLPYPILHNYTRYRAVHGDTVTVPGFFTSGGGAWGCRQSHLRILEDAMMDGIGTLLVLEDDVRFSPDFQTKLLAFMRAVPDDWEALMLGGQCIGPTPRDTGIPGIVRAHNTQRTHAYVVRGLPVMQALYRLWARCDRHIDHWFGQFQTQHTVYQPDPFICGQDETASDISGRQDNVRFWNTNPIIDNKTHPITVLVSDRGVVEVIRNLGFHCGYDRDPITGKDKGLAGLEARGWPQHDVTKWGDLIVNEALERGDIPGLWHTPTPDASFLETRLGRKVEFVEARTVEEAVQRIPKLLPAWRASKIIWCWRGSGMEVLSGLAYHGWHRGYWLDDVTGLDQGIRQAVDGDKYTLVRQIVRQLEREAERIRYGRVLLAHPNLNIELVRDTLREYCIEELQGNSIYDILTSYNTIVEKAIEMYKGTNG